MNMRVTWSQLITARVTRARAQPVSASERQLVAAPHPYKHPQPLRVIVPGTLIIR
ncbi:hypothetical protein XENOCAPTIV_001795, partial [Xenoophorus captivus]